jgi:putative addiction module killer protein
MIELRRYQLNDQNVPVTDWLRALRDLRARAQIEVRLRRISTGNFGDSKSVGEGVAELRVDLGAGYRVYYARHGQALVLLLCGGDKGSQQNDITRAKDYWADWKRRNS